MTKCRSKEGWCHCCGRDLIGEPSVPIRVCTDCLYRFGLWRDKKIMETMYADAKSYYERGKALRDASQQDMIHLARALGQAWAEVDNGQLLMADEVIRECRRNVNEELATEITVHRTSRNRAIASHRTWWGRKDEL